MKASAAARLAGWAGAAATVLVLAACTGDAAPTPPTVTVTATPSTSAQPFVPAPVLLTVPAAVVEGVDIESSGSSGTGARTYSAFPIVPGADTLTAQVRSDIAERFAAFTDAIETETQDQNADAPELQVAWDLVGSSPEVVGVRTHTIEYGGDGFDGRARTYWYDVAEDELRASTDLLDTSDMIALLDAVTSAAAGDARIDPALLSAQLDGGVEAFDSVAFTVDGDVWIEFDRAQVSSSRQPVGVEISAEDYLSDFGRLARAAALEPEDPAIPVPEPVETSSEATEPPPATITQPAGDVDCSVAQCIALTFDDGPVEGTVELLEVLEDRGVRATFFMVGGNVRAHPDVVRRIHEGGHVLGNHTLDHPDLTRLDAASVRHEIAQVNDLIEQTTGVRPVLLRPPYGATNGTVAEVAAELGMAQILWNVDPEDWKDRNADTVTERVLTHARNGAIILSHDIHPTTRAAYAGIVDALLADGYTLVTVPELLGDLTPGAKYFNR